MQLLDLARRLRQRAGQRLAAGRAVAVQPTAQLAFLSSRECGDPLRLGGVTLNERQRLQHRVVHTRRHLRALVGADPCGALGIAFERELPEPWAEDQHERAADGTGREK